MNSEQPDESAAATVLVIDDDEDTRIIFSLLLEHAGLRVQTACTGDEGLRIALSARPSVILLDIGLPVFDGFEVMRQLRSAPGQTIPVIAVSGRVMTYQQEALQHHGFARVLLKPVTPSAVLEAIGEVLARSTRQSD